MKILIRLIIVLLISNLYGCNLVNPCEDKEIQRISSPDGKVDAIMMERNCGATTSYSYRIYLVEKGSLISKGWLSKKENLIFLADHMDVVKIKWVAPKLLEIKYKQAQIYEFTNFWYLNTDYKVVISEVQVQ